MIYFISFFPICQFARALKMTQKEGAFPLLWKYGKSAGRPGGAGRQELFFSFQFFKSLAGINLRLASLVQPTLHLDPILCNIKYDLFS